jgi:hypothetical protein
MLPLILAYVTSVSRDVLLINRRSGILKIDNEKTSLTLASVRDTTDVVSWSLGDNNENDNQRIHFPAQAALTFSRTFLVSALAK